MLLNSTARGMDVCLSLCLNELELREVSLLQPGQPSYAGARYLSFY